MTPRDATQTTAAWIEACGITADDVVRRPTVDVYNEYGRWAHRERQLRGVWFTKFREDMRELLGVEVVERVKYDKCDQERFTKMHFYFEEVDKMKLIDTQTPRAWIESEAITAAILDGKSAEEIYAEYAAWTKAQDITPRPYQAWLGSIAAILPTVTLEAGTDADGRPQTYFATMGAD